MNLVKLNTRAIDTALKNVSLEIIKQIRTNTAKGIDVEGSAFADYSPAYAAAKSALNTSKRKARSGKSRYTGTVNLSLSGKMLRSIHATKKGDHYEITFSDKDRALIAYAHNEGKGQPKREFFGVSDANKTAFFNKYFAVPMLVKA